MDTLTKLQAHFTQVVEDVEDAMCKIDYTSEQSIVDVINYLVSQIGSFEAKLKGQNEISEIFRPLTVEEAKALFEHAQDWDLKHLMYFPGMLRECELTEQQARKIKEATDRAVAEYVCFKYDEYVRDLIRRV